MNLDDLKKLLGNVQEGMRNNSNVQAYNNGVKSIGINPLAFSGEMQAVNPGGFAGALTPHTLSAGSAQYPTILDKTIGVPRQTSVGQVGPRGFNALKAGQQSLGSMQQGNQSVDLSAYENAINSGNVPLLDQIMKAHPQDARFAVHLQIPGLH